jgi:3-phosphoshikimate 1-carboxyvinyltransferase
MSDVTIDPVGTPFDATLTPPGSKSLTNRALVLAALADGTCELSNVLFADDTHVMLESLMRLGFRAAIEEDAGTVRVLGRGGRIDTDQAELFCGNSGTTIRFLTALCALGHGRYALDGVARMRQRPIGALTGLLKTLGARVSHPGAEGFPPVRVDAAGLSGGTVHYGSEASSQYLSAILMIAPYARDEVRIDLAPNQTSWPYVAMTIQLMEHFGVAPALIRDGETGPPMQIIVPRGTYRPTSYAVEPDASGASYFLAAAAINPGSRITLEGLGTSSLQGDVGFADVLRRMGAGVSLRNTSIAIEGPAALVGIDVDLSDMPDTAPTLAVVCAFATGPSTIRGLHTLRVKETDRIAALSNELKKLGAGVDVDADAITITPPERHRLQPAAIDTYDDHRMAMSFAVAGTRARGITIRDVECASKTYPRFFDDLNAVTHSSPRISGR